MAEDVRKLLRGRKKKPKIPSSDFVSTGSTLLNMACSGRPRCGFAKGHYYFLVGDSNSGKTFLTLTCFAEAANNPNFDEYEFIFDDAENGALMDWERYFGSKAAERIKAPRYVDGVPTPSRTVEDLYDNLYALKKAKKKTIYVLDSMDALDAEAEQKSLAKRRKARQSKKTAAEGEEGGKAAGSYGTAKAKANSDGMREVAPYLQDTGSILIIISQTRDKIGGFMMFDTKTRSGGKSLTFYAAMELWTSQKGHIKKKVKIGNKEKEREMGIQSLIHVRKNRIQGKDRKVTVPIYHSFGIDDIGGCIDWMVEEGYWSKNAGLINARELEFKGKKEALVHHIEENGLERELQGVVAQCWNAIEEQCALKRRPRYE